MAESESTSVWLVDDECAFRETMASGLSMQKDFTIRSFENCEAALRELSAGSCPPDVILLDIQMPGIGGIRAIPLFKRDAPDAKVLMLTVCNSRFDLETSLKSGAFSYFQKSAGLDETITAIRKAVSGRRHLDQESMTTLMDEPDDRAPKPPTEVLTVKEHEVLRLLYAGLDRDGIAERLGIGEGTVVTHMKSQYSKLGVHKVTEALRRAHEEGLL